MKFYGQIKRLKKSLDGRSTIAFGLQAGYWPCLYAPFIRIEFLMWRFECWYGLPSYKVDEVARRILSEL